MSDAQAELMAGAIEPLLDSLERRFRGARARAEVAAQMTAGLTSERGVESDERALVIEASRLHEIGKLYVPAELLGRAPGTLTVEQRELLAEHYEHGRALAVGAGIPERVAAWILHARERWDGRGATGLAGADIPLASRMIAVAREYLDAPMTLADPTEMDPREVGIARLRSLSGTVLDPELAATGARLAAPPETPPAHGQAGADGTLRFVVLCRPGPGAQRLGALLGSHPEISYLENVFEAPSGADGEFPPATPAEVDELLGSRPARASGVQLLNSALRDHPTAAEWLSADHEVRVIRIWSRNELAAMVERRLEESTASPDGELGTDGEAAGAAVEIDPEQCLRELEDAERRERELDELAARHPTFPITTEQLVAGARHLGLQEFLGVEPHRLETDSSASEPIDLRKRISNADDLARSLAPTRFAPLLEPGRD